MYEVKEWKFHIRVCVRFHHWQWTVDSFQDRHAIEIAFNETQPMFWENHALPFWYWFLRFVWRHVVKNEVFHESRLVRMMKLCTRWWFQQCFTFTPIWGKIPILTNIFQRGWNHQPVLHPTFSALHHFYGMPKNHMAFVEPNVPGAVAFLRTMNWQWPFCWKPWCGRPALGGCYGWWVQQHPGCRNSHILIWHILGYKKRQPYINHIDMAN